MPITLEALVKQITPEHTMLLFGAGASIPSGAPSVADIMNHLSTKLGINKEGYTFAEFCSLYEMRRGRRELVTTVRELFKNLRPTGSLLNLPQYPWHSIYTTNYEDLIEKSYLRANKPTKVISSNFDFGISADAEITPIYKIHGTILVDTIDGNNSRLILTTEDNEQSENYREVIYDRLKADLSFRSLLIVGYSLSDEDLKAVVKRALRFKQQTQATQNIFLLLYSPDENRAMLYESQGLRVAFGGVDDLFLELAKNEQYEPQLPNINDDVISQYAILNPITIDIRHEASKPSRNFAQMYAGAPAQYPEIKAGLTFERSLTSKLCERLSRDLQTVTVLGAGGVGKTTLARQVCLSLVEQGFLGWEHQSSREFPADTWRQVARDLETAQRDAVLLLDDAHLYLPDLNKLADLLAVDNSHRLRLVITSPRNHWNPRVKSSNLTRASSSSVVHLNTLDHQEISRLLSLVSSRLEVSRLVDKSFKGFTSTEKRRRLEERCGKDFFVCLKNIFASDSFDYIVLQEFSAVGSDYQGIYRYVCALESLGVVIHRQLILRLLNVVAQDVPQILNHLEGLVEEFDIDSRSGVYGWRGRHQVISDIITRHKFSDVEQVFSLLKRVVVSLSPTYDVEIRTLKQLCSSDTGIGRVSDIDGQNELLRMMISTAPRERVPRHRLIGNLIRQGALNDAETEIRVFENDIGLDGPVRRHKVRLLVARAVSTEALLTEDRKHLLTEAMSAARRLVESHPTSPHNLRLLGDVALEVFKATGDYDVLDSALEKMKAAEEETSDLEVTNCIRRFQSRMQGTFDQTDATSGEGSTEEVPLELDG